jgi:Spy/CpxP family protein refolding chaperone
MTQFSGLAAKVPTFLLAIERATSLVNEGSKGSESKSRLLATCTRVEHRPTSVKEHEMIKKLILLTALAMALAIAGVPAWAQMGPGGGGPGGSQMGHGPMSPDQRLQMLTKQLNLTSDQQEKIKPILESESQQMQTLRQDSSLSQEDRMSKMRQIRQGTNEQIKLVLNSDQQQKFEEMMSHGHGGPHGAPPPGQNAPQPQ